MKKVWTKKLDSYLKATYKTLSNKQIAQKIKFKFNIDVTEKAVRSRKGKLKLKSGHIFPRIYTREVVDYILKNYKGKDNIELAKLVNDKFGLNVTNDGIGMFKANYKRRYGINLRTGINKGCFPKGHIPFNKGTKGMFNVGGNSGSFKKGNVPQNYKLVGSERLSVDGYIEVKVADSNKWETKNRVVWKKYNGEIPKGYKVIYLDNNKLNNEIENLALVKFSEHLILNRNKLRFDNKELTKSAVILSQVIDKTNQVENERL